MTDQVRSRYMAGGQARREEGDRQAGRPGGRQGNKQTGLEGIVAGVKSELKAW